MSYLVKIPPIKSSPASDARQTAATKAVRVLIVDDSAMMRRLLTDALNEDPAVQVVGQASSGDMALVEVTRLLPDVVTLDVEMPGMDGIETLKHIREQNARARVIMFSNATGRGTPATLKAMVCGASDYCPKPTGNSPAEARDYLRRELLPRVRQFGGAAISVPKTDYERQTPPRHASAGGGARVSEKSPQAIVIGISTGGPQALARILPQFPADFAVPVLIVQHMPANFTRLLAERINLETNIRVEEAHNGQVICPGTVLLAPGGYHMRVRKHGDHMVIRLDQDPPENSCRPAVDVLFRSAVEVWNGNVVAAVLTGMGHDGLRGVESLKKCGAWIIAQDEPSSVVWGMPGAVVNAGLADQILSLDDIVPAILKRSRYRP